MILNNIRELYWDTFRNKKIKNDTKATYTGKHTEIIMRNTLELYEETFSIKETFWYNTENHSGNYTGKHSGIILKNIPNRNHLSKHSEIILGNTLDIYWI